MRFSRASLASVLVLALTIAASWTWRGSAQNGNGGLPGALPEIDAARYPTLQAAFNAVPPTGGVVRLPPGVFEISEPLVLTRGETLIVGCGPATHIKNVNAAGQPALIVRHPDGEKVQAKDRLWRVQLANFRLTGNEKSGHGIEALLIEEIFIHGVTISHHGGDGIRLDRCYEDPRVCNSLLTYNKATGLNLLGCHDIVVSGNQFEENQDAVRCIDGYNLCFTGNCVDDHLRHGVVIENTYGSVVSGNMIEECNGTAVILDRDCYGDTISANVIAHNGAGVDLADAHGSTVSANTFTIMKTNALRVSKTSNRITVTGNNFSNSYLGEGRVKRAKNDLAAAGVTLEECSDLALTGNVFASVRPKAIELKSDPARRVSFAGNVLTDVDSDHARFVDSAAAANVPSGPVEASEPKSP